MICDRHVTEAYIALGAALTIEGGIIDPHARQHVIAAREHLGAIVVDPQAVATMLSSDVYGERALTCEDFEPEGAA